MLLTLSALLILFAGPAQHTSFVVLIVAGLVLGIAWIETFRYGAGTEGAVLGCFCDLITPVSSFASARKASASGPRRAPSRWSLPISSTSASTIRRCSIRTSIAWHREGFVAVRDTHLTRVVVAFDPNEAPAIAKRSFDEMAANERGEHLHEYHFPRKGKLPSDSIANCATWLRFVGIPIPELTGRMSEYMPALKKWEAADAPIAGHTKEQGP